MKKITKKAIREARIEIIIRAREAAALKDHALASALFASIGTSYVYFVEN